MAVGLGAEGWEEIGDNGDGKQDSLLLRVAYESGHVVLVSVLPTIIHRIAFRAFTEPCITADLLPANTLEEKRRAMTSSSGGSRRILHYVYCASAEGKIQCYAMATEPEGVTPSEEVSHTLMWEFTMPKGIGSLALKKAVHLGPLLERRQQDQGDDSPTYGTFHSSPSSQYVIAVGGWDSTVRILDAFGNGVITVLTQHAAGVNALVFGIDRSAREEETGTTHSASAALTAAGGTTQVALAMAQAATPGIELQPANLLSLRTRLLSGSTDSTIAIWDLPLFSL